MHKNEAGMEEDLSPREMDVLRLLGKAFSYKGIARELGISPGTAKWHVRNTYSKLCVNSREQALEKARDQSLVP